MLELNIPAFGRITLKYFVTDFTGTLAFDGKLPPGVKANLNKLTKSLIIHVLTADTFGSAKRELEGIKCRMLVLTGKNIDVQKADYVKKLGVETTTALGNGNNDRKMLKLARIGVAVVGHEGCSVEAVKNADILVSNINDALELFLHPKRLIATLRF